MGSNSINIDSHLPQYEHKHVFCVKEWIAYMTHQHQFVTAQHITNLIGIIGISSLK